MRIFFKRLMQDTDNQEPSLAARSGFRKLLEEIDICAGLRSPLKKFAHLVDEDDEPAMGFRAAPCCIEEHIDELWFSPAATGSSLNDFGGFNGFANDTDRIITAADDGDNAPSSRAGREGIPNRLRKLATENPGGLRAQVRLAIEQSAEGDHKA